MSTELSNGVIIPEEYSDDWYDEMSINLRKLNDVITAASDNATDIQRLDTDKANQSDLTALTSRVSQNETDIIALQTAVSGALKREIVQTLPTEDISTTTIYMIRNSQSSGTNIYDEYMYINSQWELIGTSATDFSNYYTKNETDNLLSGKVDNSTLGSYYTKTESDNLLSAKANQTDLTSLSGRVTQNETDITALQTAVSGALKREIVQSLPTQDISTTTIYMIRNTTTSGDNIYDEYMYINNLWELIGTSATDFSNYYTKTEIDTLLSGKANDSDVVHNTGDENVNGIKTFKDMIPIDGDYLGDEASTNQRTNICLRANRDTADKSGGYITRFRQNRAQGALQPLDLQKIGFDVLENEVRTNNVFDIQCTDWLNDVPQRVNFVSSAQSYSYGRSTNKALINDLNPGCLSLPDLSNGIDISSYITLNSDSSYTPLSNGYVYICCYSSSACGLWVRDTNNNGVSTRSIGSVPTYNNLVSIYIPVVKNVSLSIFTPGCENILTAKFYPCQGNV